MRRVWDKVNDEWVYEEGEDVIEASQEVREVHEVQEVREVQESPELVVESGATSEGENLVLLLSELGTRAK